jgi:hypothetical protein
MRVIHLLNKLHNLTFNKGGITITPPLPTITPPNCLQLHPLTTYSYTPPHRVRLVVTMATPYGDLTTKNLVISPTRFSSDRINSSNPMDLKCSIAVVFVIGTFLASACSDWLISSWRCPRGAVLNRDATTKSPTKYVCFPPCLATTR